MIGKKNRKRAREAEQEVPEAEAPAEPKRKRHVFEHGKCRACQQRDRARMGLIAKASAKHGLGGPCYPPPPQ